MEAFTVFGEENVNQINFQSMKNKNFPIFQTFYGHTKIEVEKYLKSLKKKLILQF